MINEHNVYAFCCEDINKIENYDVAFADDTQTWHCHHKAEILPCGRFSRNELKRFGLYYHQPANRLIFLTSKQHKHIHYAGQKLLRETKEKISKSLTGKKQSDTTKLKRSQSLKGHRSLSKGKPSPWKGKHHTDESRKKMSDSHKGKIPWNKGKNNVYSKEVRQSMGLCGEKNPNFGKHHTEESKQKMSISKSGEKHHFFGKHLSEEHRRKLSEALKGKSKK